MEETGGGITAELYKAIITVVDERVKEIRVTREDFDELKGIVRELAQAQKRTEERLGRLERVVEELARAQKETEKEVRLLVAGLRDTREEVGGLSRSFGYALENETYRMLPKFLSDRYGIEIEERLIRIEIGGREINIFGSAKRDGKDILIIGEVKVRLDEKRRVDVFKELEEKVNAVMQEYGGEEILKILVTHFATKGFLKRAKEKGIIVVQSFEW